ncbi:alpha-amylase [Clostridia bacterium]|nr:alpha-amylase [Clostridia bacterium]
MKRFFALILALLLALSACSVQVDAPTDQIPPPVVSDSATVSPTPDPRPWTEQLAAYLAGDPLPEYARPPENGRTWYQIFVYSFRDSDGDGIGDLAGVTESLDYIKNMGFDGIWLSPIHPSTTYHKYDVKDYLAIDPQYGTMADFDALAAACKQRGLDILLDLVINHTSDEHPWFVAAKAGDQRYEAYYHIESGKHAGWYELPGDRSYEAGFWDKMPDLNLRNEDVRGEIADIVKFWLDKGVRGFRLDAVKEFESGQDATNIEILTWLHDMAAALKPDVYFVGEDWDTTIRLYAYYASKIDSFFSYPFAGATGYVGKALLTKDYAAADYVAKIAEAQGLIKAQNPDGTAAPFLTNHDNPRASAVFKRDPNLIKTAWGMTLTQPGDAFVYYGEEIGLAGYGKDENKRAPMFWTDTESAGGNGPAGWDADGMKPIFPPLLAQIADGDSIFRYVQHAVRLRAKYPQLGRGDVLPLELAQSSNKVAAVSRTWGYETIVVIYNLSDAEVLLPDVEFELLDWLSATGEAPTQSGIQLKLPPYTIAILK